MTAKNPWDMLSEYFDTSKPDNEVESNAADNIFISWPVILRCIEKRFGAKPKAGTRALDFGCGGGQFASELSKRGFATVGLDSSQAMIDVAGRAHAGTTEFLVGDEDAMRSLGKFSVITSLMTLQFVEDAERAIGILAEALEDDGVLIFSVFNPAYSRNSEGIETFNFSSAAEPATCSFELSDDTKVPMYVRDAEEYKRLAAGHGLRLILDEMPPFTEEFLIKYPHPVPTTAPEYLILGFTK